MTKGIALALLLVVACSDETEMEYPATVLVSPEAAELEGFRHTVSLTAVVKDHNGVTMNNASVTWSSEDTNVATVNAAGIVSALGSGVVRILATVGEASDTATITVRLVQRDALIKLYESLNGDDWTDNSNWGTKTDLDTWFGVETDEDDNVDKLKLKVNGLTGEIPAEVGLLTHLRVLNLSFNDSLAGTIPPEIGNLENLEELELNHNGLTGEIPAEVGLLTHLRVLNLSFNDSLAGTIPPEIGNLENLEELELRHNDLTGEIPAEVGLLTHLRVLNLSFNDSLAGTIPPEIGNLENLEELELHHNDLTGHIPPEIANLTRLNVLDFHHNQLSGPFPTWVGDLEDLIVIAVWGNEVTGSLPASLGNLGDLRHLAVDQTALSGPMPRRLIGLELLWFTWNATDLCSPPDAEFQDWLETIPEHRGNAVCPP